MRSWRCSSCTDVPHTYDGWVWLYDCTDELIWEGALVIAAAMSSRAARGHAIYGSSMLLLGGRAAGCGTDKPPHRPAAAERLAAFCARSAPSSERADSSTGWRFPGSANSRRSSATHFARHGRYRPQAARRDADQRARARAGARPARAARAAQQAEIDRVDACHRGRHPRKRSRDPRSAATASSRALRSTVRRRSDGP